MYDAMTYCRAISPALLRQQKTANSVGEGKERTFNQILLYYFIPPVVLVVVTKYNNMVLVDGNITCHWIYVFMTVVVVLTLVITLSQNSTHETRIEAIAFYPLGIQLGTLSVDDTTINKLIPQEFLHRETIVDCIVTELVFSFKVQNAVMLRTKLPPDEIKNTKEQSLQYDYATNDGRNDNFIDTLSRTRKARENVNDLIRLFSDTEITYIECLIIRAEINKYLVEAI